MRVPLADLMDIGNLRTYPRALDSFSSEYWKGAHCVPELQHSQEGFPARVLGVAAHLQVWRIGRPSCGRAHATGSSCRRSFACYTCCTGNCVHHAELVLYGAGWPLEEMPWRECVASKAGIQSTVIETLQKLVRGIMSTEDIAWVAAGLRVMGYVYTPTTASPMPPLTSRCVLRPATARPAGLGAFNVFGVFQTAHDCNHLKSKIQLMFETFLLCPYLLQPCCHPSFAILALPPARSGKAELSRMSQLWEPLVQWETIYCVSLSSAASPSMM